MVHHMYAIRTARKQSHTMGDCDEGSSRESELVTGKNESRGGGLLTIRIGLLVALKDEFLPYWD